MIAGRLTLIDHAALASTVPIAVERGARIVAAGVFNSGLLARARPEDDARFEYGSAPAPVLARALRIADIAQAHGSDLPTVALQFPLRFRGVESVVVGGSSAQQIRSSVARLSTTLPNGLWDELAAAGLIPTSR